MSSKYHCPCLNVSIECNEYAASDEINKLSKILKLVENLNKNLNNQPMSDAASLYLNQLSSTGALLPGHKDSIKIKYPKLIGIAQQKNPLDTLHSSLLFHKCIICNVFTHCCVIKTQSGVEANRIRASNVASFTSTHSSCSNADKIDDDAFSCLNDAVYKATDLSSDLIIVLNLNDLKITEASVSASQSNQYSSVYDIVVPASPSESQLSQDFTGDYKVNLNMDTKLEQTIFLNSIQEAYDKYKIAAANRKDSPDENLINKENLFKSKFETFIKSYLNYSNASATASKPKQALNDNMNESNQLDNNNNSNEKPKAKRKDSRNSFKDDVFDFEENGDESNERLGASSEEEDADEEENDDAQLSFKLDTSDKEKASPSGRYIENKFLNINKAKSEAVSNQYGRYSCSLPREIPTMQARYSSFNSSRIKSLNDDDDEEDENSGKGNKHHIASSYIDKKNQKTSDLFDRKTKPKSSNDESGRSGEDSNDADENAKDMGQAISDLASSIVAKDGRELFGGVPSRRVPINNIIQSFF